MKKEELECLMANYYGTECYHRMPVTNLLVTDGALGFAKNAGAFWFLTDVALFRKEAFKVNPEEEMFSVHLIVKDNKADMIYKDGNGHICYSKHYSLTDCPEGDWIFYYFKSENLLIWNGEY